MSNKQVTAGSRSTDEHTRWWKTYSQIRVFSSQQEERKWHNNVINQSRKTKRGIWFILISWEEAASCWSQLTVLRMSRWSEDKRRTGTAAQQLRRSLAAANCLQFQTKRLQNVSRPPHYTTVTWPHLFLLIYIEGDQRTYPDVGINLEIVTLLS